jgi:hypothetical protein
VQAVWADFLGNEKQDLGLQESMRLEPWGANRWRKQKRPYNKGVSLYELVR